MYKVLFWLLMFVIYVAMFWALPLTMYSSNTYILNVLACHLVIGFLFVLALLIGFLHDKAFA